MPKPSVVSQDCEDEIQNPLPGRAGPEKTVQGRGEEQECREAFFVVVVVTVLRQGLAM